MVRDRYKVLYFTDDGEIEASQQTAEFIVQHLPNSMLLPMSVTNWKDLIISVVSEDNIFFMSTHGGIGENGTVTKWIEDNGYAHTHSSAIICAQLCNKHATKIEYCKIGVNTPGWVYRGKTFGEIFGDKYVKKQINGGSKQNLSISAILTDEKDYLYESIIRGALEISVSILRADDSFIALSPIVRQRDVNNIGVLTDYPKEVSKRIINICQDIAINIAKHFNIYGVVKNDFVIDNDGQVFVLETDAHPGLAAHNAVVRSAQKSGVHPGELFKTIATNIWRN